MTRPTTTDELTAAVLARPVTQYLPDNFPTPPAQVEAPARHLMDSIHTGQALRDDEDGSEGVPLNFERLREVNRNAKAGSDYLQEGGWVVISKSYKPGGWAKQYAWGEACGEAEVKPANGKLAAKMRQQRVDYIRSLKQVHQYLFSHFLTLDLDMDHARRVLDEGDIGGGVLGRKRALATARLIADGRLSFTIDEYGRCHTPFTCLARPLRQCVTVNGEPLVSIDVACMQPSLLGLLLTRSLNEQPTFLPMSCNQSVTNETINTSQPSSGGVIDDVQAYIRQCEAGTLYENLMSAAAIPITPQSRKRFKVRFFEEVLCGKRSRAGRITGIFASQFPTAFEFIRKLKAKNYRFASHRLQRLESGIIINAICRRIMREIPVAPLLTVHDCLMTNEAHAERIAQVMREEFQREGLNPTLKIER